MPLYAERVRPHMSTPSLRVKQPWRLRARFEALFGITRRSTYEIPLKILVVGDFGASAAAVPRSEPSVARVDRDSFEKMLGELVGSIRVDAELEGPHPAQGSSPTFSVTSLRDLAPASIANNLRSTRLLLEHRKALCLKSLFEAGKAQTPEAFAREQSTVEQLRACEAAISTRVNDVLMDSAVRAVERGWRALRMLLERVPSDANVEVDLYHCTAAELGRDLAGDAHGTRSRLWHQMLTSGSTKPPYALVVALHEFADATDRERLEHLAGLCASMSAVLLADASPGLLGAASWSSFLEAGSEGRADPWWTAFRARSSSRHVALCAQHVLLRAPYGVGRSADPAWSFEESAPPLWGSAAILVAARIVESFVRYGHGGALDGDLWALPYAERGDEQGSAIEGPLNVLFCDADAEALSDLGLTVWRGASQDRCVRLDVARTAMLPTHDTAAQLTHVLLGDRLMHHLAIAPYDQLWTHLTVDQCRFVLDNFIGLPTEADSWLRARRPLLNVELSQTGGGPGRIQIALNVRLLPVGDEEAVTISAAGDIAYE